MTVNNVDVPSALGNLLTTDHGDFFRQALHQMLAMVMESEASKLCAAEYGERSESRTNTRNGYRPRALETRVGTLELQVPKLRQGSYFPTFLEPRRRWEKAFVNVACEAYVLGVSTRKVESLVESMGAHGMSRSEVSRMATELDTTVAAFRHRALNSSAYPYLWLDALYMKVREGGVVVSKAVLVAYAVNDEGYREVLGVQVAAGEMEAAWRGFIDELVGRGLKGVRLVISDAHQGLKNAIVKGLTGSAWQRCRVHFMRNVLCRVPKAAQGFVSATVRHVFDQPTGKEARDAMKAAIKMLQAKYPDAGRVLLEAGEDVLSYKSFPSKHWQQIHSTNPLERLNKEIRRRTDVIGIFPNAASATRLIAMLLVEQNDAWAVGRRYLSLESLATIPAATPALEAGP